MSKALAYMTSKSNEWSTPRELFDRLNAEYHFTLDPCATAENAKCAKFYTKKQDGLIQDWGSEIVFMNPPYGREIGRWIHKAYCQSLKGAIIVCLIPARTDTAYWHDIIFPYADKIEYLKGRLRFSNAGPAPFPSAIVIFGKPKDNLR
jgi:phage N-6-adenine-methyltransferase